MTRTVSHVGTVWTVLGVEPTSAVLPAVGVGFVLLRDLVTLVK